MVCAGGSRFDRICVNSRALAKGDDMSIEDDQLPEHEAEDPTGTQGRRGIRSYVIRGGRMTVGQTRAYERQWPQFGLTLENGPIDPSTLFDESGPLTFEIGFGMGQSLVETAATHPSNRYIGVEVHRPGVGALLMDVEQRGLTNLRVYCCDANAVIDQCLPDASVDCLQLFFPDPWHKKKHHKRRILQLEFLARVRRVLKPGGLFHMATDWEPYAEQALETLMSAPGYRNVSDSGGYVPRPESRPITKFERRGERLGHGVWDLMFQRTEID